MVPAEDTLHQGLNDTSWCLEQENKHHDLTFPVSLEAECKLPEFDQEWFIKNKPTFNSQIPL